MEYQIIETNKQIEDYGNVKTYGIVFYTNSGEIIKYDDISINRMYIKLLAGTINKKRVSDIHIDDVIEDALAAY